MSIGPLTGTDTFKTWFDRTVSLITNVNGITVFDVKGSTGVNVSVAGGVASVSNTGILSVTGGSTGISVTTSSGVSTVFNTGVWSVNGSTGNVNVTISGGGPGGDYVSSFNGVTGGVTGVVGILAGTGIGVGSNQVNVTVSNRGVLSLNGLTGAVDAVSSFNGSTGSVQGVNSFNGLTGTVQGVGSINGLTGGLTLFGGTGMSVLSGGKGITLVNTGVLSFNGLVGAVSGVTTSAANTFTALQTFSAGLSASGGTFGFISAPGIVSTSSPNTFTALQTFSAGLSASGGTFGFISAPGIVSTSSPNTFTALQTFSAGLSAAGGTFGFISAPNIVNFINGLTGGITLTAGSNITLTPSGNTIMITSASGGSGITWSVVTANRGLTANTGTFAAPSSGILGLTLPTSGSDIGSSIRVSGVSGGWRIGQGAGQQVFFGNLNTTLGTGGYLESTDPKDTVELVCWNSDTRWNIISSIGNIGVV